MFDLLDRIARTFEFEAPEPINGSGTIAPGQTEPEFGGYPAGVSPLIRRNARIKKFAIMALLLLCLVAVFLVADNLWKRIKSASSQSHDALPAGLVELKEKWVPGKQYVSDYDFKQNAAFLLDGRSNTVDDVINLGFKFGATVAQETPEGGHELEVAFLSARMSFKWGDWMTVDFNSANESAADHTNGVAAVFGEIVGSKIRLFLNASNDAERLEGVGELVRRIQSVPQTDAKTHAMKDWFNAAYFEQFTNRNFFLPRQAMQAGDTWVSHHECPSAGTGIEVSNYKIVFQNWEMHENHRCARLELQGIMKVKPDPNSKRDETTYRARDAVLEGVIWFDPELGQTVEADLKNDINVDKQPGNTGGTQVATGRCNPSRPNCIKSSPSDWKGEKQPGSRPPCSSKWAGRTFQSTRCAHATGPPAAGLRTKRWNLPRPRQQRAVPLLASPS